MAAGMASALGSPSRAPELIRVPSPEVAVPVTAGSSSPVSSTARTGRSKVRAKSRSRWSWAGTAMMAPVP